MVWAFAVYPFMANVRAQPDVSESALAIASAGRIVRVGTPGSSRTTDMPLEVYVARVLAAEGEPGAGVAAQQALAIAIRTFALANRHRHSGDGFGLCDTTHCQVLRASTATSRDAAVATAGRLLLYRGQPAEVFYSASCGGRSEAASNLWPGASYPYLRSHPDDVCQREPPWTLELSLRELRQKLVAAGFAGENLRDVRVDRRNDSGRVMRLRISGLQPEVVAGDQFRTAIGVGVLRSTAFTVIRRGSSVQFSGRGYGHGVGLCVVGAGRRARRGESVEAILAQYYPRLEIARLDRLR